MNNRYRTNTTINSWDVTRLVSRVDALLLTLKACKGHVCTRPWETLHPKGDVLNLQDAMNSEYDKFYLEEQAKVTFTACKLGYLAEYEGVMTPTIYGNGDTTFAARWSDWTWAWWEHQWNGELHREHQYRTINSMEPLFCYLCSFL